MVDEVQNAFELGLKLHGILGENFYQGTKKQPQVLVDSFYSSGIISEDTEDDFEDEIY